MEIGFLQFLKSQIYLYLRGSQLAIGLRFIKPNRSEAQGIVYLKKKNRNRILATTAIVLVAMVLYFKPFASTEIIILDHLTQINDDGVVNQICLVKNPPSLSSKLEKKIYEFNDKHPVKGKHFHRLFIKEHENPLFFNSVFQDDVNYEAKTSTRSDLHNLDFLATSIYWPTKQGTIHKKTEVYTGKIWYYKF